VIGADGRVVLERKLEKATRSIAGRRASSSAGPSRTCASPGVRIVAGADGTVTSEPFAVAKIWRGLLSDVLYYLKAQRSSGRSTAPTTRSFFNETREPINVHLVRRHKRHEQVPEPPQLHELHEPPADSARNINLARNNRTPAQRREPEAAWFRVVFL
jgi:hypothetical protein